MGVDHVGRCGSSLPRNWEVGVVFRVDEGRSCHRQPDCVHITSSAVDPDRSTLARAARSRPPTQIRDVCGREIKVAEWYKGRMVLHLGGSGKVSFGRRIREEPGLRIQGELYTRSEVVSSPK